MEPKIIYVVTSDRDKPGASLVETTGFKAAVLRRYLRLMDISDRVCGTDDESTAMLFFLNGDVTDDQMRPQLALKALQHVDEEHSARLNKMLAEMPNRSLVVAPASLLLALRCRNFHAESALGRCLYELRARKNVFFDITEMSTEMLEAQLMAALEKENEPSPRSS